MAAPVDLVIEAGMSTGLNSINTRYTSAGAVLTNPNTQAAYEVSVVFNLVDAAGNVLDTESESIEYIPAGGRAIVAPLQIGFDLKTEPSRVDVTAIVGDFRRDTGWPTGSFSLSQGVFLEVVSAAIDRGGYGLDQITGQVRNNWSTVVEHASIDCVLTAGATVVGGESTGLFDPIVPGGTIAFDVGISHLPTNATGVECQVLG